MLIFTREAQLALSGTPKDSSVRGYPVERQEPSGLARELNRKSASSGHKQSKLHLQTFDPNGVPVLIHIPDPPASAGRSFVARSIDLGISRWCLQQAAAQDQPILRDDRPSIGQTGRHGNRVPQIRE
jgi:hypothetical protein